MAETFGKRQRGQRKKERQLNKKLRKQDRAAGNSPDLSEDDIARDYFDGIDPNDPTASVEPPKPAADEGPAKR